MDNNVQAEYYEAESFWSGDALRDPGNVLRIKKTIELLPSQVESLLDVGCGNGLFGHSLMKVRPEISVTGVDRSKAALSHVKFTSHSASIDSLPFDDKSYDLVSCLQVIEHLPRGTYELALSELARLAKSYIVIGVPFEEDLEAETTKCPQCKTLFNINLHLRDYNLSDVRGLFSDLGFKMVAHEFPAAKVRKKYVNEILTALKGSSQKGLGFLAPICPICAYTEGDRTALNVQSSAVAKASPVSVSRPKKLAKTVFRTLSSLLPQEMVNGYWVVALYERV